MSKINNATGQSRSGGKVILIEDNPDHAYQLKISLGNLYSYVGVEPEIIWFQYFEKAINYLQSDKISDITILSIWIDLYLGKYGDNKEPNELLNELNNLFDDKESQIFPISSLIGDSKNKNFVKKENISSDNNALISYVESYVEDLIQEKDVQKPEIDKKDIDSLKRSLYGYELTPGLIDKYRLLERKLEQLELDTNFQYMKLEKLVLELKSATWILWVIVKLGKRISISEKLVSIIISILAGSGITLFIIELIEVIAK